MSSMTEDLHQTNKGLLAVQEENEANVAKMQREIDDKNAILKELVSICRLKIQHLIDKTNVFCNNIAALLIVMFQVLFYLLRFALKSLLLFSGE